MTKRPKSFPPLIGLRPRLLICGTMPSLKSLEKRQFYGYPQNLFWKLMGELLADPSFELKAYSRRCELIKRRGIALWDTLASCRRSGSLDAAISDPRANPIPELLKKRPSFRAIAFTGKASEGFFRKLHDKRLPWIESRVQLVSLPSPSPANAGVPWAVKRRAFLGLRPFLHREKVY